MDYYLWGTSWRLNFDSVILNVKSDCFLQCKMLLMSYFAILGTNAKASVGGT